MSKYYAFIKDGRVGNVAVFETEDEELADRIAHEQGYDDAVYTGDENPPIYSSYDGTTFTKATDEYLISIGIMQPPVETE
jgi:hypothetical protein